MKKQVVIKLLFVIAFVFLFKNNSFAQINFKQVDSTSFSLYESKQWQKLTDFANKIKNENFDYYLFNLRLGIANYELKKYYESIVYFNKALKNNAISAVAKEYLYWNYLALNDTKKTTYYFSLLDENAQKKIQSQISKTKIFDFIYIEGGQNYQQDKSFEIGDVTYFNLGLNHNFNSKLSFYHAYYYQKQELKFDAYKLHRYYAYPSYLFNDKLKIGISLNFLVLNDDLNFSEDIIQQTTENDVLLSDGLIYDRISSIKQTNKNIGTITEKEINANITLTRYFNKFKLSLFGGTSRRKTTINAVETINGTENIILFFEGNEVLNEDSSYENETFVKQDSTSTKYNFGINVGVDLSKKIGLAFEFNNINYKSKNELNYVAAVTYELNKKFNFSANIIQKGKFEYYYNNNAYLINNLDKTTRLSFVSTIHLTEKINLYLVYQHDIIDINLLNKQLNSNTFITGIKYKL
jgi:hypothetical protein